jgi:hypothetical protein
MSPEELKAAFNPPIARVANVVAEELQRVLVAADCGVEVVVNRSTIGEELID